MKAALAFLIFAFAIYLAHGASGPQQATHNVSWGEPSYRDVHLKRQVVYKRSRFLRKVEDDFLFSVKAHPYAKVITRVVVTDQYRNGDGGYATLTSGGPHSDHVKLHFTSQRNHGFNFIIDIYGY